MLFALKAFTKLINVAVCVFLHVDLYIYAQMVSPIVQSQLHHIETFFMVFYRVAGITITLSTLKTVCKLIKLNEVVRSRISLFDLILQTSLECNLAVFRRMQPPFFLYHGLFEQ